ncbi:MAG: hypothetical protein K2W95_31620 [Candidatus Obscuribacterales bacterium]|nr:hypothetical protein [Candidatus Obscuribacterales bacterium]
MVRDFSCSIIDTYFEMGAVALSRGEFNIAEKMYLAASQDPALKRQRSRFQFPLLMQLALTRESQRKFYRAKLLYIRALAFYKKHHRQSDAQVLEILCILARVNVKQGLFKQAVEFVDEARQLWLERRIVLDGSKVAAILQEIEALMERRAAPGFVSSVSDFLRDVSSA